MSLFRLKEWWSAGQGAGDEEFDQGSLAVGAVDGGRRAQLVTGSYSGLLRVFQPRGRGYDPADQLLEQRLAAPILQLAVGRYAPGAPLALAVLHPQCLAVYQLERPPGVGPDDDAPFLSLCPTQTHHLTHTAANMCTGEFGGERGHDGILVQSLDGRVSIFRHGELVQATYWEDFLVPGPLAHVSSTDAIVTCSSAFELQSYAYASLLHAVSLGPEAGAPPRGPGVSASQQQKTASPQWLVTIGELAVDLQLVPRGQRARDSHDIVAVGEHTIVVCSEHGVIQAQWRLDYHPAAAVAYRLGSLSGKCSQGTRCRLPSGAYNLLVATHTSNFIIYSGSRVAWLAKGPIVPVAVRVTAAAGLEAAIVALDDVGALHVCYLGTAPPAAILGLADHREPDWDRIQSRRKELARLIREREGPGRGGGDSGGSSAQPHDAAAHVAAGALSVRSQVTVAAAAATEEETAFGENKSALARHVSRRSCQVKLFLSNASPRDLSDVAVCASSHAPIDVTYDAACVRTLRSATASRTPQTVVLDCTHRGTAGVPATLELDVAVTATAPDGSLHCANHAATLPLSLFVTAVPPVRSNAAQLTLAPRVSPALLHDLFEDVLQASPPEAAAHSSAASLLSFRYASGEECTVLVGKNSSKYRLQGTSFHALWPLLRALHERLREQDLRGGHSGGRSLLLDEAIPLSALFDAIDAHFTLRHKRAALSKELELAAAQFRVAQKSLLVRYKEAKPAALGPMQHFLERACQELRELADELEAATSALATASERLGCDVQFVLLCLRCRCCEMSDDEARVAAAHLNPIVDDTGADEIGWEEVTDAAIVDLLRGPKSAQEPAATGSLEPMLSCEHFKRRIELFVDRTIASQGHLLKPGSRSAR